MSNSSIFAVDPPNPETVNQAKRAFAIHPGIGIARMGNSLDEFFIGPETPGVDANWNDAQEKFNSFRDAKGRIKRQGARFRVFEYFWDPKTETWGNPQEVRIGGDVVDIEWRVHLANRKASFFVFDGQNGADDNYLTRNERPANEQIKTDPNRTNRRNADVAPADRAPKLEIDPGELTISALQGAAVEVTNSKQNIPIDSLGTLKVDDQGRLIVLGGYGQTKTTGAQPEFEMEEYASNDRWFDDASDGSVKARLKLKDGTTVDAEGAWVMVGPPDFAPAIGNVVSLYDTLWDVAVRKLPARNIDGLTGTALKINEQRTAWLKNNEQSLNGYKPSFLEEIYPLLKRAAGVRDVHKSGEMYPQYHRTFMDWGKMSALEGPNAAEGKIFRNKTFEMVRDPNATVIEWKKMPRGHGDNYRSLEQFDDKELAEGELPVPNSLFSLTRIQYAVLHEWAKGNFVNDWPGEEPKISPAPNPTPDQLDKAATDNSVGGPFYPGIDCSWLIRTPEIYLSAFRFQIPPKPAGEVTDAPLRVGALEFLPGFFSQQMALPWQADFYDCQKERHVYTDGRDYFFMWWSAHRPDDVFPSGGVDQVRWTRLLDDRAKKTPEEMDDYFNFDRFIQMLNGWHDLKFISVHNGKNWEEENTKEEEA